MKIGKNYYCYFMLLDHRRVCSQLLNFVFGHNSLLCFMFVYAHEDDQSVSSLISE